MNVEARRKRQRPPPSPHYWSWRWLSLPHMTVPSSSLEWWWTVATTSTTSTKTNHYGDHRWYPIIITTTSVLTPPPPPQWMSQLVWPRRRRRHGLTRRIILSRIVGMVIIIIITWIIQVCSSSNVPFPFSFSFWSHVVSAYTIQPISLSSWKQKVVISSPPPPQLHLVRLFSSHQNNNTNDRSNGTNVNNNSYSNNGGQSRPKRTPSSTSSGTNQKGTTTITNNNNRNGPRNHSATKNPKYFNNNNTKSGKWNATTTSKQELVQAVGKSIQATRQKQKQRTPSSSSSSLTTTTTTTTTTDQLWNPYQAGQKLRQSIETTITSIQSLQQPTEILKQSPYYIDDRFMDRVGTMSSSSSSSSSSVYQRPSLPWDDTTTFIPEILVVGATGRLGRLIVRQLRLLSQPPSRAPVRVRVLVRDLYTRTLDILGTGVTYCQGDLLKMETLEDAVTDIDKLVFVASSSSSSSSSLLAATATHYNATGRTEEEREEHYRQKRIQMAEQIDVIGMSNLISAYQNVRHADYGTSQAAKRSLFKFQGRHREDFFLFSIDEDDDDVVDGSTQTDTDTMCSSGDVEKSAPESMSTFSKRQSENKPIVSTTSYGDDFDNYEDTYENLMNTYDYVDTYDNDEEAYNDKYDDYNEDEGNYEDYATSLNDIEKRNDASVVKTQSRWLRNSFGHGVFVGRIPQAFQSVNGGRNSMIGGGGGEAAIISSRLRSRDDPDMGIELGPNFAGFISRICSDGNTYEAFVRTGSYATNGIEYVCEFSTSTKGKSSSRNKFLSVRLPFSSFKPVQRKTVLRDDGDNDSYVVPPFRGYDVRHIGFRYRCSTTIDVVDDDDRINARYSNNGSRRIDRKTGIEWNRFYLAICYIKVYRSQPEPEFVYVSDARIPPIVRSNMVEHELKQILPYSEASLQTLSNRKHDEGPNLLQTGTEIRLELQNSPTTTINEAIKSSTASQHNSDDTNRIPEETYYKYRGEELLKKSGLSYAIVRVGELCDSPASLDDLNDIVLSPSTSAASIDGEVGIETQGPLKSKEQATVSRADIAQICVQALLNPNALNKSFYVHRRDTSSSQGKEDISTKFASIPTDSVP